MGSFCKSNEVVVWRKASTCHTTCSHKDYILSLHSFFVTLANYKFSIEGPFFVHHYLGQTWKPPGARGISTIFSHIVTSVMDAGHQLKIELIGVWR